MFESYSLCTEGREDNSSRNTSSLPRSKAFCTLLGKTILSGSVGSLTSAARSVGRPLVPEPRFLLVLDQERKLEPCVQMLEPVCCRVVEVLQAHITKEKQGEGLLEENKPSRAVRLMALLEKHSMLMSDSIFIRCNYLMH